MSNFPNIHNLARAIRVTVQTIESSSSSGACVKIDDMRVLPPAFLPKKIRRSFFFSFLFFYWLKWDDDGITEKLKKKKVWKLPWRFSISGHLYKCTQSCFSLSCNQVTCVKTSFFSPIFLEIMVISCQQTKNETSSFQTVGNICSPVLSVKREWIGGLGASHFTLSVIRVVNPVFWVF